MKQPMDEKLKELEKTVKKAEAAWGRAYTAEKQARIEALEKGNA